MALIELYAALYQEYKRILTDRQYEVLWLHEIEGLSGKEISGRLDISQTAVSRHLTRGKAFTTFQLQSKLFHSFL